ncbi:MAG: PLP-dependent aspartate aminotransferase family protein [Bacteroidota bacterium]|nr:PLP-dependent aspartate aminotransferase family protein [Bacteroidota bacterium]MDP4228892.1 PLP-dependent aspartate aminotransferase family protein [Bacteroidota bacterium]MDP4234943.1 PLP-dependent aspartate aminotransferase family protein [Bacteroidota bacterium]
MNIETVAIQSTTHTDSQYGSIGTPLYQTSNFRFRSPGVSTGYDYTRSGNPTRNTLEQVLAELEGGAGAVAVSTGMSAIATVLEHFDSGSHIICTHDCYGGTARLLNLFKDQGKFEVSFVDLSDPISLLDSIQPNSRCLWIETPSNPLLTVVDVEALAAIAHSSNLLVCVDNTFLSPFNFLPFEFGADVVIHSTTKWLNGHSDVCGGAIISKTTELAERFKYLANALGTSTGVFDSWLVLRGIKTLGVRMRQHEANALVIAAFLEKHPNVSQVFYPGLASHPTHELAKRFQKGYGGVISFRIRGSYENEVCHVLGSTKIFALAESLGGVESLIEHPATMSHASMGAELREKAGITDDIIRISIGIEHIDDLLADLSQALDFSCFAEKQSAFTAKEEVVA